MQAVSVQHVPTCVKAYAALRLLSSTLSRRLLHITLMGAVALLLPCPALATGGSHRLRCQTEFRFLSRTPQMTAKSTTSADSLLWGVARRLFLCAFVQFISFVCLSSVSSQLMMGEWSSLRRVLVQVID